MSADNSALLRVAVPGGTGTVGEGVVRAFLVAGAEVLVPTRTSARAEAFRDRLGEAATSRLHLPVHDYTSFAGAEELLHQMEVRIGGVDAVVAPIGGWWQGGPLATMSEDDWTAAFTGLATAHAAMLRAALPRLGDHGAHVVIVGDSARHPVPGSGLVSMEQAALLMMQRVAVAEGSRRVFALRLGPVGAGGVEAADVGRVALAIARGDQPGAEIPLHDEAEVDAALTALSTAPQRA